MKKETTDIIRDTLHLYKTFDDVAELKQQSDGKLYYKGKQLSDVEFNDIINEANVINQLSVLEIVLKDLEHTACQKMYYQGSEDLELLKGGKWILFTVDLIRRKLNNLEKLQKRPNLKK